MAVEFPLYVHFAFAPQRKPAHALNVPDVCKYRFDYAEPAAVKISAQGGINPLRHLIQIFLWC